MNFDNKCCVRTRVLQTAIKMFLCNGYKKTTMREIASKAGVNYGSLMFAFKTKEALVCELVGYVIDYQFEVISEHLKGVTDDKILQYAAETALQLHVAEMMEQMREMYIVSYSMANSSQIIYDKLTKKQQYVFKEKLPNFEEKDFYELEIAAAGIMRNFLTIQCDKYFTVERKINRFLETTFLIYRVSEEKIEQTISFVNQIDFISLARHMLDRVLGYIEGKI